MKHYQTPIIEIPTRWAPVRMAHTLLTVRLCGLGMTACRAKKIASRVIVWGDNLEIAVSSVGEPKISQ